VVLDRDDAVRVNCFSYELREYRQAATASIVIFELSWLNLVSCICDARLGRRSRVCGKLYRVWNPYKV
jgi:hypothetical protein